MGSVLAIVNQHGGVGKSTSSRHIAQTLSGRGKSVLLVDFDPLSGTDQLLGFTGRQLVKHLTEADGKLGESISHVDEHLDLLTAGKDLIELELAMTGHERREYLLDKGLQTLKGSYDFVIIDAPSSLGLLTENALAAADAALVPVRCHYFGQEGIAELMHTIGMVSATLNDRLRILGFVITHVFQSLRSSQPNINEIRNNYGNLVFNTLIHEAEDLEADYSKLTDEILQCL